MRRDVEVILAQMQGLEADLMCIRRACPHVAVQITWCGDRYWRGCVSCGHLVRRALKAEVDKESTNEGRSI